MGWAWQQFISDATAAIIAHDDIGRQWLLVLVDVITALIVCTISGYVLLFFEIDKQPSGKHHSDGSGTGKKTKGNSLESLEAPLL